MNDWFNISLDPKVVRTLTREQYYEAYSWVRKIRREMRCRHWEILTDVDAAGNMIHWIPNPT